VSRIGRLPVPVPAGVDVNIDGCTLAVKGPKGALSLNLHPEMQVVRSDDTLVVERPSDSKSHRALHGLTRALVANAVTGVSVGFTKRLEIVGVGYQAELHGRRINLKLGFTHLITFVAPEGIELAVPKPTIIDISGHDRQLVGEVAALIRGFKPPEPYKGKGIRYAGEYIERKAGKAGKK
jgi:large subunit ribosomal protein L6